MTTRRFARIGCLTLVVLALPLCHDGAAQTAGVRPQAATQLVRRYFEDVINKGNVAAIDQIVAGDFELQGPPSLMPEPLRGAQTFKQVVEQLRATFPDLQFTVHDIVAENDIVMASWTMRGTHRGEWLGVPATSKLLTMTGVDVFRVSGGKIQSVRIHGDYLGVMRQMVPAR